MTMFQRLFSTLALLSLAACGGGGGSAGGSGGGGGGTAGVTTMAVTVNPTTVTAAAPGTVTATITSATGAGVAGQVVQFSAQGGLGVFSAASALTDDKGNAVVTVRPASANTTGADSVVATSTVGGTKLTAQTGFQLTATNVTITSFTSDLGNAALAPYGQSVLTVVLSAAAQGTPVNVSLSSSCVTSGQATLTPGSATTTTGTATFTYRDNGCGANGRDTLQASIGGSASAAALTLTLTPPTVSSIAFVSATPATIYLRGSGYVENSNVIFQVRDTGGNGVRGQTVSINPTTLAGGLQVNGVSVASQFPLSAISDANGNVVVRVNSGTVPTPVRIRASLTLPSSLVVSTVSSTLAIAVGLPSQLNFSLSQGSRNIEGYDVDGTKNTYTIIASDRLGNPVPDGTAINFVSEGGQVQSIVFTATSNGLSSATAQFQTSQPRPADGRLTVLSYALGEKSFIDADGDNVYTASELFQDLGDPYLDTLYNGQIGSSASNQFILQTPKGSAACNSTPPSSLPASLQLDVSIPSRPTTCTGSWGTGYVRRGIETIFSTSSSRPMWGTSWPVGSALPTAQVCSGVTLIPPNSGPTFPAYSATGVPKQVVYYPVGGARLYGAGAAGVLSFFSSDANPVAFNPVAAGSTVSVSATTGLTVSVAGGSPVASTSSPTGVAVNYAFDPATSSGTVTINIRSPGGLTTSTSQFLAAGAIPAGYTACP